MCQLLICPIILLNLKSFESVHVAEINMDMLNLLPNKPLHKPS